MDQLPPDQPGAPGEPKASPPPSDLVAAQIKQQLQSEVAKQAPPTASRATPQAPASADPGFAFNMRMKAGGADLTDSAEDFKAEHGEAAPPPAFTERDWDTGGGDSEGGSGNLMKIVLIVLVVIAVGVGVWLWGLPAFKSYQEKQATLTANGGGGAGGKGAPAALDAVTIDDAFDKSLRDALLAGNAAWKKASVDAYVYRYHVKEEKVENASQTIEISAEVGGKDASKAARDSSTAFDTATASFQKGVQAHSGVKLTLNLIESDDESTPEDDDKYLFYGYDYGREHMSQLKPIIDALEQLKTDQHDYPRVLSETLVAPKIRTSGGIKFMPKGIGYLPLYKTDSSGTILMGTGGGTLDRMTPAGVDGYYLFLYLGDQVGGLDVLGPTDVDYYSRKLAPLPYDIGTAKLHNMPLKPDGTPDGIGAVVKNGKLLREGEV